MDLMAWDDLPFVIGPVLGPIIVMSVWAVIVAIRPGTRLLVGSAVLTAIFLAAFTAYWYVWGIGFDEADAGRPIPPVVQTVSSVTIAVTAAAACLLVALGVRTVSGRKVPAREA